MWSRLLLFFFFVFFFVSSDQKVVKFPNSHLDYKVNECGDFEAVQKLSELAFKKDVDLSYNERYPQGSLECDACVIALDFVRAIVKKNSTEHTIEEIIVIFCEVLKIEDQNVCVDIIKEFQDVFWYIVINDVLTKEVGCAAFGFCPPPDIPQWNVTFDSPKPPVNPYPPVVKDHPKIYILEFTDAHLDSYYTAGLEAECGEPICCRPPNPPGTKRKAGKWGDYNCDSPRIVFDSMLDFINSTFGNTISYAVFTGDIPPHDVWMVTRNESIDDSNYIANTFKSKLPEIPLYPAVGNHESVPVNEFPTRDIGGEFNMSWLYDNLADRWAYWLPKDAVEQARYAGYYTVLAPDGTRIVSLNTNLGCNSQNWWLKIPTKELSDPDQQLHWFAKVMEQAEKDNEVVYLIYHISPEPGCIENWYENYYKIIYRYENNILGVFSGHTHVDEFRIQYANESATKKEEVETFRPMHVKFFPGSVTSDGYRNPGFRIVEIDNKTKAILEYHEYAMNLTEANILGNPVWKLTYNATSEYSLPDMSPQSWHDLAVRMNTNSTLTTTYYHNEYKGAPTIPCNSSCLHEQVCNTYVPPPGYTKDDICGK
eukprot:CAMPEP_0174277712 /NCGR_PEP_ID=MMETSP0439-20130205/61080_1 /TAXON_ID=0 /ORGANISM="Stereomyxa ramosa, Strain Chinc5" /LENGTH=594 /DNA_ID=CAMNT_0015370055 /DNA_START=264 /DNA_END=2048 /DNA_ORIENTATION=+